VRVHLLFPEHAVSDIHIGRCNTGKDSFLDLRAGIVELEFQASSLYFFLSLFLRTFLKAPADREGIMDDKSRNEEVGRRTLCEPEVSRFVDVDLHRSSIGRGSIFAWGFVGMTHKRGF
jgi:hypothetical protein